MSTMRWSGGAETGRRQGAMSAMLLGSAAQRAAQGLLGLLGLLGLVTPVLVPSSRAEASHNEALVKPQQPRSLI